MNRKRIAFLTGFTILMGSAISSNNPLRSSIVQEVKATEVKTDLVPSRKYPDVTKKLDLTSMAQYESANLFMNVTLKKFYIKYIAVDKDKQTHLLLAPLKNSDQYFLTTITTDKKLKKNQQITIQGFLNGKSTIDQELINIGFNAKYLNKRTVSILTDKIAISRSQKKL